MPESHLFRTEDKNGFLFFFFYHVKQKVLNGVKKIPSGVKYIIHSREGSGKRRLDGPWQEKDERTVWEANLDKPAMLLCSVSLKVITRRESLLSLKPFFAFIAFSASLLLGC